MEPVVEVVDEVGCSFFLGLTEGGVGGFEADDVDGASPEMKNI